MKCLHNRTACLRTHLNARELEDAGVDGMDGTRESSVDGQPHPLTQRRERRNFASLLWVSQAVASQHGVVCDCNALR